MILCPKCGLPTEPNVETHNLCQKCYTKTVQVTKEKRKIVYCGVCKSVRAGGKWQIGLSIDDFLKNEFGESMVLSRSKEKIVYEDTENSTYIFLYLKKSICINCLTQKNDSYLFEVKIRVESRNMVQREILYVKDLIRNLIDKSKGYQVYRFSENKEGVDVLTSSKKLAEKIVWELDQQFDGKINQSFKLISETHDGVRIYKTTFSFKIFYPSRESVYRLNDQLYQVIRVEDKKVFLRSIKADKELTIKKYELINMYRANQIKVLSQKEPIV